MCIRDRFSGDPRCMQESANLELQTGSEMPDAFFFGSFATGSSCTQFRPLHDVVFAGVQLQLALKTPVSSDFNATEFALGYGSHIVGDVAGFAPGGYLGNGHLPQSSTLTQDWLSIWPFMSAVDSYVAHNRSMSPRDLPALSAPGGAFMEAAVAAYQKVVPGAASLAAAQAVKCSQEWADAISPIVNMSTEMPMSASGWAMMHNDQYGAGSDSEAQGHFELAHGCAVKAIQLWGQSIVQNHLNATEAEAAVLALYGKMFAAGECSPTPPL
eukprot:TRINITY_DN10058_c0_g1_i1.p1 TRINITY_DN10058_c0_g1~~TRINITY_DN10058_c0_g1_i1.p1  ORF type:complete len:310 (-),score=35.85 TRINITY_DN10058_c0_g1_i1:196-1005(-)